MHNKVGKYFPIVLTYFSLLFLGCVSALGSFNVDEEPQQIGVLYSRSPQIFADRNPIYIQKLVVYDGTDPVWSIDFAPERRLRPRNPITMVPFERNPDSGHATFNRDPVPGKRYSYIWHLESRDGKGEDSSVEKTFETIPYDFVWRPRGVELTGPCRFNCR